MSKQKSFTVCLAGNPNSGKTTIFNNLTKSFQKIGNYAGVTVEIKEGYCKYKDYKIKIIDLPGTYSLTAYSMEEIVARDFIIEQKPDVVIDIVDASNLNRNLYLATQLKELSIPMVIALNMFDLFEKEGHQFDIELMSKLFGTKFIKTVGYRKEGMNELLDAVIDIYEKGYDHSKSSVAYDHEVEKELDKIIRKTNEIEILSENYCVRWLAVKLLENDENVLKKVKELISSKLFEDLKHQVDKSITHINKEFRDESDVVIADNRYGYINGLLKESLILSKNDKVSLTEKIDRVVLNNYLGLPIFGIIMYLMFYLTIDLADPVIGLVDKAFASLGVVVKANMPQGMLRDMLSEGVIGGIGGVLVFVPQILILFFFIALLEATGYMARAAFVIDRLMHKVGLHGKSFIPMLLGFGCTVPALLASRTLENEEDRKTTMLVTTFMSCGARFPVYVLLVGALFAKSVASYVIFSIYILGIIIAIISAKLLKKFVYKGEAEPFVMELPPYRMPKVRYILHHMWEKTWMYIQKAGTILLSVSVIFWFLTSYPKLNKKEIKKFNRQKLELVTDFNKKIFNLYKNINSNETITYNKNVNYERQLKLNPVFNNILKSYKKILHDFKVNKLKNPTINITRNLNDKIKKIARLKTNNGKIFNIMLNYISFKNLITIKLDELKNSRLSYEKKRSYAGRFGTFITPIFTPMGLNDWRISISLVGGLAAKEVVVGTLGAVYAVGDNHGDNSVSLRNKILNDRFFQKKQAVHPNKVIKINNKFYLENSDGYPVSLRNGKFYKPDYLKGYALMVFVLLYIPCLASLAVYLREAGPKHTLFMLLYTTAAAYITSTVVYQAGRLIGL